MSDSPHLDPFSLVDWGRACALSLHFCVFLDDGAVHDTLQVVACPELRNLTQQTYAGAPGRLLSSLKSEHRLLVEGAEVEETAGHKK